MTEVLDATHSVYPTRAEMLSMREFWDDHYAEFVERYPDQFVAALDGEVVIATADYNALLDELERRGLRPVDVWIEYIRLTWDNVFL